MNFNEFYLDYSNLFGEDKKKEALELNLQGKFILTNEDYELNKITIECDRAFLYYVNENFEGAIKTLETLNNDGIAVPENFIKMFQIEDERLESILRHNQVLIEQAQKDAKMDYKVCVPQNYDPTKKYPLFFNIHGDGIDGNIHDQMRGWAPEPLLEQGFIVVYPQSSQTYCTNGHGWMKDKPKAREEIKLIYDEVIKHYSVDVNQVIIAGFSGGADAVVDFCMHQVFPMKGFISLCPTRFVKSEFTNDEIIKAMEKGMKGCILEGALDMVPEVKTLANEMNEMGFECQYLINADTGHYFPGDLHEKVKEIIDFINE